MTKTGKSVVKEEGREDRYRIRENIGKQLITGVGRNR